MKKQNISYITWKGLYFVFEGSLRQSEQKLEQFKKVQGELKKRFEKPELIQKDIENNKKKIDDIIKTEKTYKKDFEIFKANNQKFLNKLKKEQKEFEDQNKVK